MLKINLLTTTALVLIASTACAIAQPVSTARDGFGNNDAAIPSTNDPAARSASAYNAPVNRLYGCGPQMPARLRKSGRNRNAEFLNTYGYRVCNYSFYDSESSVSGWENVATPIKGKGNTITQIMVKDCLVSNSPSFTVGLYKDSQRSPGELIASGRAVAKSSCGWTSATIPRTLLKAGKRYWVLESNSASSDDINAVTWVARQTSTGHNALFRYHHFKFSSVFSQNSNYTSPWLPVSGPRPFVKVK